jgi:hypothetical protein
MASSNPFKTEISRACHCADDFTKTLSDLPIPILERHSARAENKLADDQASAGLSVIEVGGRSGTETMRVLSLVLRLGRLALIC